jgi:O-antigen ligase
MSVALMQERNRLAPFGWKIPLAFVLLLSLFLTAALANGKALTWAAIPFALVGFVALAWHAPDFLFVAAVFVPQWKTSWPLSLAPDLSNYLTVAMLAGLALGLFFICFRISLRTDTWSFERVFFRQKHALFLFALFTSIVALSYLYTDAPSYGGSKLGRLFFIGGLFLLAPLLLLRTETAFRRFSRIFVSFALLTSLEMIIGLRTRSSGAESDITRIGAGWLMGMALLLILLYPVFNDSGRHKLYFAASLAFLAGGLVASAARGALVSFVLILPLAFLVSPRQRRRRMIVVVVLLAVSSVGAFLLLRSSDPAKYGAKIAELVAMSEGKSTRGSASRRIPFYVQTAEAIPDHAFFGKGVGSWSVFYYGNDARGYPHNLLLEITFEEGFLGLAAFALFFGAIVTTTYRTYQVSGREFSVVPIIVLYALTVSMFSGDMDDNRLLWLWAGVALAICRNVYLARLFPAPCPRMNYDRTRRVPGPRPAGALRHQPPLVQNPSSTLSIS